MSSINNKTNADVYAAFNKLGQEAASNDASMSGQVKQDAAELIQAIASDGDLSATDKKSLLQQAAALLPMAGEGGHATEWNEDIQKLADQLSALPTGITANAATTVSSTDSVSTNAETFAAYNALNTLAGTNLASNSGAVQTAAQTLLTQVATNTQLSATQRQDLTAQVTQLLPLAGKPGNGAAWNKQMQALVNSLSDVAKGAASTSNTSGAQSAATPPAAGASIINVGATSTAGTQSTTQSTAQAGTASTQAAATSTSNTGSTVVPVSSNSAPLTDKTLYPSGNGPTLLDIQQGSLNSCTLDAGLSSLVHNNPSAVTDMIKKNSDGTYGITLFPNGKKTTVNIDPKKDIIANGTRGSGGAVTWASMVESAAGKVGFSFKDDNGAQPGNAMQLLTGTGGFYGQTRLFGGNANLEKSLKDQLASGKMVLAGTLEGSTVNGTTIDTNHAYAVLSVADGQITLRNPWPNQPNNGVVKMSVADYAEAFGFTYMQD